MPEYKVNVVNAPGRFLLIAADSPLEADRLAKMDGYSVFGVTTLVPSEPGTTELEKMTPRELRQLVHTMQADLKRAVEDRRKLLVVMDAIYNAAWQGMEENPGRDGYALFSRIADEAAEIKSQVEGKR